MTRLWTHTCGAAVQLILSFCMLGHPSNRACFWGFHMLVGTTWIIWRSLIDRSEVSLDTNTARTFLFPSLIAMIALDKLYFTYIERAQKILRVVSVACVLLYVCFCVGEWIYVMYLMILRARELPQRVRFHLCCVSSYETWICRPPIAIVNVFPLAGQWSAPAFHKSFPLKGIPYLALRQR